MTQTRIYDSGATAITPIDNLGRYSVVAAGVYRGFDLGVDSSNNLTIAAGNGCQHNGIVWTETAANTITFTPGAPVATYTVVATHIDSPIFNGAPVTYSLQAGIATSATNGVILGWIYYPGGSIPLDATHLVSAPKLLNTEYIASKLLSNDIEIIAPLPRTYTDTATMGANVVYTQSAFDAANFVVYQSFLNGGLVGPEIAVQHVQYFMGDYKPLSFDIYTDIDSDPNTNLIVQVYDSLQALVTATGSPFLGTGGWATVTLTVDRLSGTFTSGTPWTLRLTHNLGIGKEIKISRIVAKFWPYPV